MDRERLAGLLVDPREDLNLEIKNWLDLVDSNEDKAKIAKAMLAIANHGGGFIVLGHCELEGQMVEAEGRPATLNGYSQDLINGIVQNYCDPPFHCAVHVVPNRTGALFPLIVVPGGHRVPIRARRAGPNGNTVANNAIYIRRPGPRSESPQSAQDWNGLLERCLRNRRDEMLDQIRDLITGSVPQVEQPVEPQRLEEWIGTCLARWRALVEPLAPEVGPRFPHGRYCIAYEITGDRRDIAFAHLPDVLRESVVRHTGWPPFWYPSRAGIAPYPIDGAVECWLGGDSRTPADQREPADADFWRIHPDGLAFLIRGFQEDGSDVHREGRPLIAPGTVFDINLPIWRVGEALVHARSLASNLFDGPSTIRFVTIYEGLAGRTLVSIDSRRAVWESQIARQDSIRLDTHVDVQAIDSNLPEIIHPFLSPLYNLFDFFDLPRNLVSEELARLRAGNY